MLICYVYVYSKDLKHHLCLKTLLAFENVCVYFH